MVVIESVEGRNPFLETDNPYKLDSSSKQPSSVNNKESAQVESKGKKEQSFRHCRITIRLSDAELEFVKGQSMASMLTKSEFSRLCILGKRIVSKADLVLLWEEQRVLGELRRLGGLLKHIHNQTSGIYSEDTRNAIRALESFAKEQASKLKAKRLEEKKLESES